MDNKEWHFLICVCQKFIGGEVDLIKEFDFIENDFNWKSFQRLAYYHRIIAIIYNVLIKIEQIKVPPEIGNQMVIYFKASAKSNLGLTKELIELTNLFKEYDLRMIPYKGVLLSHFVYNNLGARPSADIDIMIDPSQLNQIKQKLDQAGYEVPKHKSSILFESHLKNNCEISINKKLSDQLISNLMLQMNVGYFEMISETTKIDFFGTTINLLKPEALFTVLCMHHYGKEKMVHLKQIIDLGMVLKFHKHEMDWDKLVALSKEWKVYKLTLYSLKICQDLLKIDLPKKIVKQILGNCDQQYVKDYMGSLVNSKGKFADDIKDDFNRGLKLHLKVRDDFITKWKVIYYHWYTIIIPNETDFENPQKISNLGWYLAFLKKPFRLFKSYIFS
jgi:hypothetical protein